MSRTSSGALSLVARLRQNPGDTSLLNSLTNLASDPESWSQLRNAELSTLFVDLISAPYTKERTGNFPFWVLPLQGCFNCMVGIQRTPEAFRDQKNREAMIELLERSPDICLRISEDKDDICGSEEHSESVRQSLTLWIQAIWNGAAMLGLTDVRNRLKISRIITLATWCWFFALTAGLRSKTAIALSDVLDQPHSTRSDLDDLISACGSLQRLINVVNDRLRNIEAIGELLANEISLLVGLTGQTVCIDLVRQFTTMKTHWEVINAIRRDLIQLHNNEETWRVMEYSGMVIVNVINEAKLPTEELTELIMDYSLVPLLGGILLRCAQSSKESASWFSLLTLLKHTCTCTSKTCRVRTSPTYISALRSHLSWRWWPTLTKLHSINNEASSKVRGEWLILGRMAGLKEEEEKQKYETGEGMLGCWWVDCVKLVHPSDPSSNPELRASIVFRSSLDLLKFIKAIGRDIKNVSLGELFPLGPPLNPLRQIRQIRQSQLLPANSREKLIHAS
ncbi:hypothetical protein BU17DRAFT_91059 [Hysterangium stoloniferum]|nr:hypothetical protein BU17DRAFT_91059 [Hysterangium stoloniferum]